MRVILHTNNYQYWNNLKNNEQNKYNYEKERISKDIIRILDKHFGNIRENIEVIDVATPATFKRYTNNWMGSTQGWIWGPKLIPEFISKELPGLKNFYMIGQWVIPGGGVSTAFNSGRDIAQIICKKDNKEFRTS
jgi:phytoene dehydrogenase-like protein